MKAFTEALESGAVPRLGRLTYAEVTAEGARLREWGRGLVAPPVVGEVRPGPRVYGE